MGVFLANTAMCQISEDLMMAYMSQPGHAARAGEREEYGKYLLDQLTAVWATFASEFSGLWHERASPADANLCNPRLKLDSPAFGGQALAWRLQQIWHDALGFAGCEMIRRIVGLAHVADFETIVDPDRRAECEQRAIQLARGLLMERSQCRSISELTAWARACG